jgi:hypothetical protein
MDRARHTEKQPERRTSKSTAKAGPRPWEVSPYIHQESSRDDKRSSHGDPRLEFTLQGHGQHQDSCSVPSDGDPKYIHSAFFGSGATPDLYARDELGTLAGSSEYGTANSHFSNDSQQFTYLLEQQRKNLNAVNKRLQNENRNLSTAERADLNARKKQLEDIGKRLTDAQQAPMYAKAYENVRKFR